MAWLSRPVPSKRDTTEGALKITSAMRSKSATWVSKRA